VTANENPSSHRMLLPSGQLFFLRIIHNKNSKTDVGVYHCNATNPQTGESVISNNATLQIAGLFTANSTFYPSGVGKSTIAACVAEIKAGAISNNATLQIAGLFTLALDRSTQPSIPPG